MAATAVAAAAATGVAAAAANAVVVALAVVAVAAPALVVDGVAPAAAVDAAGADEVEAVSVGSLPEDVVNVVSTDLGAVAAFEDGRGDLEAEHGGADAGCRSLLEQGMESVEAAVALDGAQVTHGLVAAVAAAAVVEPADVDARPTPARPSRLFGRIWPTAASARRGQTCRPCRANTSAPACGRCRSA